MGSVLGCLCSLGGCVCVRGERPACKGSLRWLRGMRMGVGRNPHFEKLNKCSRQMEVRTSYAVADCGEHFHVAEFK